MIENILSEIGLSDKEIKVYLTGLKIGPALANSLSGQSGISRQNTYEILKKLISRGLATSIGEKYDTRFVMENPSSIKQLLERKKDSIEAIEAKFAAILPEIESQYNNNVSLPKIKFYEGRESIKNLYLDTLNCQNKEIMAIVPTKEMFENIGVDFAKYYVAERVKREIKTKTIRLKISEDYKENFFHKHEEQLRSVRYAPKNITFHSTFFIYDNKTVFISSNRENFAFLVESEEYKNMMTGFFNTLWQISVTK